MGCLDGDVDRRIGVRGIITHAKVVSRVFADVCRTRACEHV